MEEAKLAEQPQTQDPIPDPNPPEIIPAAPSLLPQSAPVAVAETSPMPPPPPPPAPAAAALPSKGMKRPLENHIQIHECSYFKMRAILKDIRPHFLEVLRTVNFRSCKGADEIHEKLKAFMELYKEMIAETIPAKKIKFEEPQLSSENGVAQKPSQQLEDVKPADVDAEEQSRYIGGSAFGWNFITFTGNKPVYYGRTKESFRASQESFRAAQESVFQAAQESL